MADSEQFPGCCGLIVIYNYGGGHPGSDPDNCKDPEEVNDYLSEKEQVYYGKRAGLVAVLSEPQNDRVGDVFLSRKWEVLMDGIMNPRTGQRLWMYFRNLNPTESRKKRIFGE